MENTKEKKHEWYELNSDEREELILELQDKGYNVEDLNNYFDVKTDRAIADFMNSKGYSKRNNMFKKNAKRLEEENTLLLKRQAELLDIIKSYEDREKDQLGQNSKMLDIIEKYQDKERENQNQLVSLMNEDKSKNDRVLSILEQYMAKAVKNQNNVQAAISMVEEEVIDLASLTLPIPVRPEDFVDRKTVRVSYRIYNNFNDLCKSKFSKYKQQDLVSLALQMFIDKYK